MNNFFISFTFLISFFFQNVLISKKPFGIITFINSPYKELLENLICNLEKLQLTSFLHIVLAERKLEHFVKSKNISYTVFEEITLIYTPLNYGDENYWYISRQKLLSFIEADKYFERYIFTDVDVLWLKNPLKDLEKFCDVDVCFQSNTPNGYKFVNSGFFYVKSSKKTRYFFENSLNFSKNIKYKLLGDQDVINDVLKQMKGLIHWKYLKLENYPNGGVPNIWKNKNNFFNTSQIFAIHNNWIISMTKKKERFQAIGGWYVDSDGSCKY